MPTLHIGDAVDLLDGGEVVAKGRVINTDPNSTIHGQSMPAGHFGVCIVRVLKGHTYVPYPPAHEPELDILDKVVGYIIPWPSVALAEEGRMAERSQSHSHSRSHHRSHSRRSHSSSSSHGSRDSKYSSMSEEDFETEARKRGWVKNKEDTSEATSKGNSCFGDCFGSGSSKKKEGPVLETVIEDEGDDNFEFRPHTQLQFGEHPINPSWTQTSTPETTQPSTPRDSTPITTAETTPTGTPLPTPSHPRAFYYDLDENGGVVSNTRGKRVLSRMRELMGIYFPDDILTDWRRQPEDSKNAVLDHLHREFPNPSDHRFRRELMLNAMNQALKSRRGTAREAGREGARKPPTLSDDDWRRVHDEQRTFPNRWEQQREANRIQRTTTGINRFGSGGRANFLYRFEETVGRKPTGPEYREGFKNSLKELLARMRNDGIVFFPKLASEMGPRPDGHFREDLPLDSDEEDLTYEPSDEAESEDETMDTEQDANIWLQDVDQPASSRRFNRR